MRAVKTATATATSPDAQLRARSTSPPTKAMSSPPVAETSTAVTAVLIWSMSRARCARALAPRCAWKDMGSRNRRRTIPAPTRVEILVASRMDRPPCSHSSRSCITRAIARPRMAACSGMPSSPARPLPKSCTTAGTRMVGTTRRRARIAVKIIMGRTLPAAEIRRPSTPRRFPPGVKLSSGVNSMATPVKASSNS